MKRNFIIAVICVLMAVPAYAGVGAPVDVNRQTFFNDITDSVATIGKSDHEKKQIKHQRQLKRKKARLQKALEKSKISYQGVSY
jgi:hypothetical protein